MTDTTFIVRVRAGSAAPPANAQALDAEAVKDVMLFASPWAEVAVTQLEDGAAPAIDRRTVKAEA